MPAGTLSHQIRLSSGRLMDDVVGYHFAVVGEAALLNAASADTKEAWRRVGAVVLPDEGGAYLSKLGTKAIIIRPDRYLLGVAGDDAELRDLSALLSASQVGPSAL
jgi:3-(3-hydroxy-phenyl)propionate hydroxylase